MADTEEPQFSTLKERIAALNQQKAFVGNGNGQPAKRPPPPPPPAKASAAGSVSKPKSPALPARPPPRNAPPLPRRDTQTSLNGTEQNGRPPLPSRTPSAQQTTPQLPRRPSAQSNTTLTVRRNSASSERSVSSGVSSLSLGRTASSVTSQSSNGTARYNLPPVVGMADLPKLPPTRRERELQAQQEAEREAKKAEESRKAIEARKAQAITEKPAITRVATQPITAKAAQPPTLPSRPTRSKTEAPVLPTRPETTGARKLPPLTQTTGNKIRGFGDGREEKPPPLPTSARDSEPPPVPVASRPSLAAIDAAKARASAPPTDPNDCLACRDFSEPDRVGALYPRQTLPRNDPAAFLAQNLCAQFPSYTDKARAIFAWCHHNIAYDTYSFFNNCVKHVSPTDTILSGLAVCQGYAESYKTIAEKAGLECVVIGGHGKGYGYKSLQPGEPVPPQEDGHAWNAVRIDGGKWKVIDACWGAGALMDGEYRKGFNDAEFCRSNEEMGETHFPRKPSQQFREDGRVITWEEYFRGKSNGLEPPLLYGTFTEAGFSRTMVEPSKAAISVYSGGTVRFSFTRKCPHWTKIHKAKDQPLCLTIHGRDGRKKAQVPVETDGYWYWVDVNAIDLGAPGESVSLNLVTELHGEDTHGMSQNEFKAKMNGIYGIASMGLAKWDLVR